MNVSFDELEHPRATSGVFIEKRQSSPEMALEMFFDTSVRDRQVTDYAGPDRIIQDFPMSTGEVVTALNDVDGERAGNVRLVVVAHAMARIDDAAIYGPADGKPLLLDISSGVGSMTVKSGFVVIRTDSPFPQDIVVEGSAEVTVIIARGRSAVVRATDESAVFVIAEEGARGILRMDSVDAIGQLVGEAPGFHIVQSHAWPESLFKQPPPKVDGPASV
jgi:hypothetical protein